MFTPTPPYWLTDSEQLNLPFKIYKSNKINFRVTFNLGKQTFFHHGKVSVSAIDLLFFYLNGPDLSPDTSLQLVDKQKMRPHT